MSSVVIPSITSLNTEAFKKLTKGGTQLCKVIKAAQAAIKLGSLPRDDRVAIQANLSAAMDGKTQYYADHNTCAIRRYFGSFNKAGKLHSEVSQLIGPEPVAQRRPQELPTPTPAPKLIEPYVHKPIEAPQIQNQKLLNCLRDSYPGILEALEAGEAQMQKWESGEDPFVDMLGMVGGEIRSWARKSLTPKLREMGFTQEIIDEVLNSHAYPVNEAQLLKNSFASLKKAIIERCQLRKEGFGPLAKIFPDKRIFDLAMDDLRKHKGNPKEQIRLCCDALIQLEKEGRNPLVNLALIYKKGALFEQFWPGQGLRKYAMEYLIRNGADVNARDEQGKAALHYAVGCDSMSFYDSINPDEDIAKLLVNSGADIHAQSHIGLTPVNACLFKPHFYEIFFKDRAKGRRIHSRIQKPRFLTNFHTLTKDDGAIFPSLAGGNFLEWQYEAGRLLKDMPSHFWGSYSGIKREMISRAVATPQDEREICAAIKRNEPVTISFAFGGHDMSMTIANGYATINNSGWRPDGRPTLVAFPIDAKKITPEGIKRLMTVELLEDSRSGVKEGTRAFNFIYETFPDLVGLKDDKGNLIRDDVCKQLESLAPASQTMGSCALEAALRAPLRMLPALLQIKTVNGVSTLSQDDLDSARQFFEVSMAYIADVTYEVDPDFPELTAACAKRTLAQVEEARSKYRYSPQNPLVQRLMARPDAITALSKAS